MIYGMLSDNKHKHFVNNIYKKMLRSNIIFFLGDTLSYFDHPSRTLNQFEIY